LHPTMSSANANYANLSSVEIIARLEAKVANLTRENAILLEAAGGTTPKPVPPIPMVTVKGLGVTVQETSFEAGTMAIVLSVMFFLWALPFARPFKRFCETRRHRAVPAVTIINIVILVITLHEFHVIHSTTLFFALVKIFGIIIDKTESVLIALAALFFLWVSWAFKDRILEAIGVDNPQLLIGDCRDWVTCWSMQRFRPVELHIWKVEDLPALKMHSGNDVFVEVTFGYNVHMRTRVHPRAGHNCVIKESIQLNFDPYDKDSRLHINVRNQDIIIASDIATVQLGTSQINRMSEKVGLSMGHRTLGWGGSATGVETSQAVWNSDRFRKIDLVPKGVIWLRFTPVDDEELYSGRSCPCTLL